MTLSCVFGSRGQEREAGSRVVLVYLPLWLLRPPRQLVGLEDDVVPPVSAREEADGQARKDKGVGATA